MPSDDPRRPRHAKVVTFDFWNTLISDDGALRDRRVQVWHDLLVAEGVSVDADAVRLAMREAGRRFDEGWRANQVYVTSRAVDDILAALAVDPSPSLRDVLLEAFVHPDPERAPHATPHVGDALEGLRSEGIRIGIICDVGFTPSTTLRRYLELQGLLDYFDHFSFSDEVGTFKPDPAIFDHALDGLGGHDPADAAHVGDLRRTDVAGARGMGIFAVRYSGVYDDPGDPAEGTDAVEGDAVVADHADLLPALGLA